MVATLKKKPSGKPFPTILKDNTDLTRTTKIVNIIYGLTVLLFLLDCLTSFDIKSQGIKSFVYFGVLIGTPFTLIWNFFVIKTKSNRMIGTLFPAIILTFIVVVGPMNSLFSTSAWHTQTIVYTNQHANFKTIEFQMQDVGAFGYNQRTVEVIYLTPFFMITREVPNSIDNSAEWVRVDQEVNELGLNYP